MVSCTMPAPNSHPYVITSDLDFENILHDPTSRVSDGLMPSPAMGMRLGAMARAYQEFWRRGAPWAMLVKTLPRKSRRALSHLPNAPGAP